MKTIIIEGMMCKNCVAHVKEALEEIGNDVSVSLDDGKATVDTKASKKEITEIIEELGFEVKEIY